MATRANTLVEKADERRRTGAFLRLGRTSQARTTWSLPAIAACPIQAEACKHCYACKGQYPTGLEVVDSATIPLDRIDPRFRVVWEQSSPAVREALSKYFLPHHSRIAMLQPRRPRVIKWYCPFAHQHTFSSGHRYCINVYTGCSHDCAYCYAASYEPACASPKRDFEKLLQKDLEDLERFQVPPAPVHISNSTDPFQPLELRLRHTKLALEIGRAHV